MLFGMRSKVIRIRDSPEANVTIWPKVACATSTKNYSVRYVHTYEVGDGYDVAAVQAKVGCRAASSELLRHLEWFSLLMVLP